METTNPCENGKDGSPNGANMCADVYVTVGLLQLPMFVSVVDTPSNVMISRTTNSELKQSE